MTSVRFYYDYLSPFTYLASTQIDRISREQKTEITWEPVLLGGIMKATGNQPPAVLPARAAYMAKDLVRWAEHYGVPYQFSPCFPFSPVAALRAAIAIKSKAPRAFSLWNERCFRAAWAEGKNLSDPTLLGEIARACDVDPAIAIGANDVPEVKEALKESTARAIESGAFGVPWIVVDDGGSQDVYFGNDRLALLEARLASGKAWSSAS